MGFQNMNKKGSMVDVVVVGILLLALSGTAIVGYVIASDINDEIQASEDFSAISKEVSENNKTSYLNFADNIFLIAIIALAIGAFVSATLLNTHPFFFLGAIIIMAVIVSAGAAMSNAFEEFSTDPSIEPYSSDFVVLPFIFAHYPKIMVGLGVLLMIGLFAKSRSGGEV